MSKIKDAAIELETIAKMALVIGDELEDSPNPYSKVYWLRRELGRILKSLGHGTPNDLKAVDAEYSHFLKREYEKVT